MAIATRFAQSYIDSLSKREQGRLQKACDEAQVVLEIIDDTKRKKVTSKTKNKKTKRKPLYGRKQKRSTGF
jgi:hypothetical protein